MSPLTPQERRVLEMIAAGNGGGAIADELDVSEKVVRDCRYRAMAKLGLRNTADVTRWVYRVGEFQEMEESQP